MMLALIRWTKPLFLALCLALLSALLLAGLPTPGAQAAPPAPGSLDTAFGVGGVVTTAIGSSDDWGQAVAVQSDGQIVVAGYSDNGSNTAFALARYTTDGSLDTGFGLGGVVTTAIGNSYDYGQAVAVQSDGQIVVAGYSDNSSGNSDFALARYNANGSLDTTFGVGGVVTTAIGSGDDFGYAVAVQSNGQIVVAGYSDNGSNTDFALARYNADGSLDTTFDTDGIVTTDFGSGGDYGQAVAVQSDGQIVVAGYSDNGSNTAFALARYTTDGSLDTGFGLGGVVTTAIGSGGDWGQAVAVQSDGQIVVAGYSYNGSNSDFALARYNADGSLDTTFGVGGVVTTAIGNSYDRGYALVVQNNGQMVVAGESDNGSSQSVFALARYNANGSLDTGFGSSGVVTTAIGSGNDTGNAVAVQSDGQIVVAGYSYNGSNTDFALARYIGAYPVYLPLIVKPVVDTSACKLPRSDQEIGLGFPRPADFMASTGVVKAVVLFADFSDAPATLTPQQVYTYISPSAADYFRAVSYDRMNFQLEPHFVWLRMSKPSTQYGYADGSLSFDEQKAYLQEAITLADPAVDFSGAQAVYVLTNPDAAAFTYGPAFNAHPGSGITVDGHEIIKGATSGVDIKNWKFWLNHEVGHTMGLPDLYAHQYDSSNYDDQHRFVGGFSLMGFIDGKAPEWLAYERWYLGWLADGQIVCQQTSNGTTPLSALEIPGGLKAVVVPTGPTTAVVVESRRALGYDSNLAKSGALVYKLDTSLASGQGVVQVVPAGASDPYRDQSPLANGESVTVGKVTVKVIQATTSGDTVQVTVAP